jgi:CheY-like chemotaxis protein
MIIMDKKYTVLYIDDNSDNRVLIERFLDYEGFQVYSADTGQSGLTQATEVIPDVFLIDINLPDMSGYEVIDALNQRLETQHVPKVIFSAEDVPAAEKSTGFNYFIPKPLDINTLAERLEYAIEHPNSNPGSIL